MATARKHNPTDHGDALDWDSFKGFTIKPAKPHKRAVGASPATPVFEGTHLIDRSFDLSPSSTKYWRRLSRFHTFTIQGNTFNNGDIMYVKPEEQQNRGKEKAPVKDWIAKILDVRASDASHVFLRVFWMYRPEDLPGGRRPYHGCNELIASNDMDIIEALTVDGLADVMHWEEHPAHSEVLDPDQLFWRQTFDITKPKSTQLSELPLHCIDNQPTNPDELLIQCDFCKQWLHGHCLEEAALQKVYAESNVAKPEGRHPKKGAEAFEAKISIVSVTKSCMTIKDKRPKAKIPKTWTVPIHCLVCDAVFEDKEEATDDGDAAVSSEMDGAMEIEGRAPSTPVDKDDQGTEVASIVSDESSSPVRPTPEAADNLLELAAAAVNISGKRKEHPQNISRKRQKTAQAAADTVTTVTGEEVNEEPEETTRQEPISQSTPPPPEAPEPGLLQSGLRRLKMTFINPS